MDATQKRRMKILARIHFGLTLFFVFLIILSSSSPFHSQPTEARVIHATWLQFWLDVLKLLQLLPFLIVLIWQQLEIHSLMPLNPVWLVAPIFYGILLVSSLVWSFCFSWIFVKMDNWLNHFPVLGKRVF